MKYLPENWLSPIIVLTLLLGCTNEQASEKKTIQLSKNEASQNAKEIRRSVSTELAKGFNLQLWAFEDLMGDPASLDLSNKGEAYVGISNRRRSNEFINIFHKKWASPTTKFTTIEDRKKFLQKKLAPGNSNQNKWLEDLNGDGSHDWRDLTVQKEEIVKVEDTDEDGIADRSQQYIKDFNQLTTGAIGTVLKSDKYIYAGIAPNLWRLQDINKDGIANKKRPLSYGYGVHIGVRGHNMSGLTKGPDGRLYWAFGDHGININTTEDKRWKYPNQGVIVRSEPDGSNFEVYAHGLRNSYGISFDKYGNLIAVDNDGSDPKENDRIVYPVFGSDSGWRFTWQYGKYSDPKNNGYNPWIEENYFKTHPKNKAAFLLPPIAPYHPGPAGIAYNSGTALGGKWKDYFFSGQFAGSLPNSGINAFKLKPSGASFTLEDDQKILRGILTTSLDFGPEGALYFSDWVNGWTTNNKGRIWKLNKKPSDKNPNSGSTKQTKKILSENFINQSKEDLLHLLRHPDMRVRKKAQFELANRGDGQTLLKALKQTKYPLKRIHGIWGLWQLARQDIEQAIPMVQFLHDPNPEIRAQTAKVLGDIGYQPASKQLIQLLKDRSSRVVFFATQALGRIGYQAAVQPIITMLDEKNDKDVYLRNAVAIALAQIGGTQALVDCTDHSSRAVRIAAVVALRRLKDPGVSAYLDDEDKYIVTSAARAINDDQFIKEAIPELAAMLEQQQFLNEPLLRRAINANLFSGRPEDAKRLASFASRKKAPVEMRVEALATLGVWPDPSVLDRVTGRFRGEIKHDASAARQAVAPVINELLTGETDAITVAAVRAVGQLPYPPAFPTLLDLIKDNKATKVEVAALKALDKGGSDQMQEAIKLALNASQQKVRMLALEMIANLDLTTEQSVKLLSTVLKRGSIIEQQSALQSLGNIQHQAAYKVLSSQLDNLLEGQLASEIQLDLINAAKNSDSEILQSKLKQYEAAKPKGDSIAVFREVLRGGNAERGRKIFYQYEAAQCQRCHTTEGEGGEVGPNLNKIGARLSRRELLQALVNPTGRIAPGYGTVSVELTNGNTIHGTLTEEADSYLVLQNTDNEVNKIPKKGIVERTNDPSAMPPMSNILSRTQLRDMVEFLKSLK